MAKMSITLGSLLVLQVVGLSIAHADHNSSCKGSGAIKKIEEYLICQSDSSLNACAGIGTGLAAKKIMDSWTKDTLRAGIEHEHLSKNSDSYRVWETAKANRDTATKLVEEKLQSLTIKEKNPVVAYKIIDGFFKEVNARGKIDDTTIEQVAQKHFVAYQDGATIRFSSLSETGKTTVRNALKEFAKTYRHIPVELNQPAFMANVALIRKYRMKFPIFASGFIGASIFIGSELSDSSPTACSETNDRYMNRDSENNCEPKYEVNAAVLRFLSLPEKEQETLLTRDSKLCSYYTHLQDKLYEAPKFSKLDCRHNGFDLKTQGANGNVMTHRVSYYTGTTNIRQINLSATDVGARMKLASPIELTESGQIKNLEARTVAATALPLKVYISKAHDYCLGDKTTPLEKYIEDYNSHVSQ